MESLVIRSKTRQNLLDFCTFNLIESVFPRIGSDKIKVDDKNLCEDKWEITNLLQFEHEELLDNLKVIYAFQKLGGILEYEGKEVPYQTLFRLLNKTEPNIVLLYWAHNEANDVKPIYDKGEINIPRIMPRYVCTQTGTSLFQIEKWFKGEYVLLKGGYTSKEVCEKEVEKLNQQNDD